MLFNEPQNERVSFSFELFPPKTDKAHQLFWASVDAFSNMNPAFISVTCGAGGIAHELAVEQLTALQKRSQSPVAAHLTCVGKTIQEIECLANIYWDAGIRHIIALRGDQPITKKKHSSIDKRHYAYASDLVLALKRIAPFEISVAGYPEGHPEAASLQEDIKYLKQKVDAGADRIITQFFFDNATFLRYRDAVRHAGINLPLVPGILPISDFKRTEAFSKQHGIYIPKTLHALFNEACYDQHQRQHNATHFVMEQCNTLYKAGVLDFHFFTLNASTIIKTICTLSAQLSSKST